MYIQQTRSDIYCSYLLLMKLLELRHCKQLLVLLWLNASSFSAVVLGVIRSHSLLQRTHTRLCTEAKMCCLNELFAGEAPCLGW